MVDRIRRSWLIVPAHNDDRIAEAAQSGADVIVLDLQDLVHDSKKHKARAQIREAITTLCAQGAEVFVRSDIELLYADLHAGSLAEVVGGRGLRVEVPDEGASALERAEVGEVDGGSGLADAALDAVGGDDLHGCVRRVRV